MANNDANAVEDIEIKKVEPTPDSPDDEYLPVPGSSPQTEPEASTSAEEKKPGDQPEEVVPEQPRPTEEVQPQAVVSDKEDVNVLAQELQNLSTDYKRKPGESTVEYARRLEIIRLRKNNREKRGEELLGEQPKKPETPAPQPAVAEEEDDITPEEVARVDKIARKAGYVKQSEVQAQTYQEKAKTVFDSWLASHPDYDEAHDPDGVLWGRLKQEFNSGLYNIRPPDPTGLRTILDKIHADILGIEPTSNLSQVKAKQEKIKVASHAGASPGGNTSAPEDKSKSTKKALLSQGLKGFTDEEIEELAKD